MLWAESLLHTKSKRPCWVRLRLDVFCWQLRLCLAIHFNILLKRVTNKALENEAKKAYVEIEVKAKHNSALTFPSSHKPSMVKERLIAAVAASSAADCIPSRPPAHSCFSWGMGCSYYCSKSVHIRSGNTLDSKLLLGYQCLLLLLHEISNAMLWDL